MAKEEKKVFRYTGSVNESKNTVQWLKPDGSRFFPGTPMCPYCAITTKPVYDNSRSLSDHDDEGTWTEEDFLSIYECKECGWWYVYNSNLTDDGDVDDHRWSTSSYVRAILEVHKLSSPTIPIDALGQELIKTRHHIHEIHDKAMERLVAGVMREHYPGCEVELCGKSGDGGIDLYIVLGEEIIGVQVKRRLNPNSVEVVSSIREFFGAGVAQKLRNLVYVSTAKRFTRTEKGAINFAENVVRDNIIDSFELVNRDRFFSMLDLVVPKPTEPFWVKYKW